MSRFFMDRQAREEQILRALRLPHTHAQLAHRLGIGRRRLSALLTRLKATGAVVETREDNQNVYRRAGTAVSAEARGC